MNILDGIPWFEFLFYVPIQGDAEYLRFLGLQNFDEAMQHLEETYAVGVTDPLSSFSLTHFLSIYLNISPHGRYCMQFMTSEHQYISRKDELDKVIVFERGDLIFVFNFHWCNSYFDYKIGCAKPGKYKVTPEFISLLFSFFSDPSNHLSCTLSV